MTIRQLVAVAQLEADLDRSDMKAAAIAARIAQADKRGWTKAMNDLEQPTAQTRQPNRIETQGEVADPDRIAGNPLYSIPDL